MNPRVLRWLAIAIAIAAVVDPSVTSMRTTQPEIALVAADPVGDSAVVSRIAGELAEQFTVIPAPFAPAAATVVVGTRLPAAVGELQSSVFAVNPVATDELRATIEAVNAPAHAALAARVPMAVTVHITGGGADTLETTLHLGDAVIDRVTQAVESGGGRQIVNLSYIPTTIGSVALRVSARLAGSEGRGGRSSHADLVIDVRDDRWGVLFFDPRASLMSTFVRRAVERDPRFVVSSRIVTSRNISIDAGRPPASLGDAESLGEYDAIVVGAAQVLTDRDVAGLEAFLRRRGGTVVLLLDDRANGAYERLAGVRQWSDGTAAVGFSISATTNDSVGLRASSMVWPTPVPFGARVLAASSAGARGERRPIVWRTAVGGGQLIISGALDAWRYRDPAQSAFDAFWRTTIADAAAAGATPIDIELPSRILEPDERVEMTATVRALALANDTVPVDDVTATLDSASATTTIRVSPTATSGRYRAYFRAPATPGLHRLRVAYAGAHSEVALLVAADPARPRPDESHLVDAWIASRGGSTFSASEPGEVRSALERTLRPAARRETWYPMRSAWWIVPFTLLLGAEWLWRRRSGLA